MLNLPKNIQSVHLYLLDKSIQLLIHDVKNLQGKVTAYM